MLPKFRFLTPLLQPTTCIGVYLGLYFIAHTWKSYVDSHASCCIVSHIDLHLWPRSLGFCYSIYEIGHANLLAGKKGKSQTLDISWQFRYEVLETHRAMTLLKKKSENLLGNSQDLTESMEISSEHTDQFYEQLAINGSAFCWLLLRGNWGNDHWLNDGKRCKNQLSQWCPDCG